MDFRCDAQTGHFSRWLGALAVWGACADLENEGLEECRKL